MRYRSGPHLLKLMTITRWYFLFPLYVAMTCKTFYFTVIAFESRMLGGGYHPNGDSISILIAGTFMGMIMGLCYFTAFYFSNLAPRRKATLKSNASIIKAIIFVAPPLGLSVLCAFDVRNQWFYLVGVMNISWAIFWAAMGLYAATFQRFAIHRPDPGSSSRCDLHSMLDDNREISRAPVE